MNLEDYDDELYDGGQPARPGAGAAPGPETVGPPADWWLGSHLDAAMDRWHRRATGIDRPIPTVLSGLNALLDGGLWPGDVTFLTGSTGVGKSQIALTTAVEAARKGTPVLYVGLELGHHDMIARVLGYLSGRRWSELHRGRDPVFRTIPPDGARSQDWTRGDAVRQNEEMRTAIDELRALPFRLEIGQADAWHPGNLRESVERMTRYCPGQPPFVVIDYLQLVGSDNRRDDTRARIAAASKACRMVARDQGAAVLVISSIARSAEQPAAPGKPSAIDYPTEIDEPGSRIGLGKESGEIEYSADVVLSLSRPLWVPEAPAGQRARVAIAVAKNRYGGPGWAFAYFTGTEWVDAPHAGPQQTPKKPKKPDETGRLVDPTPIGKVRV